MAAGLGFKTFNTGDVLSAADVNGYLMQGVLVFADATARDAAITSPQEGQFAYTKDNNSLWYYSGSAWVSSGATGDIEGVTAGVGISGGGTSGTVTVTNSMATAIDAKGDLVVGTGADTFSKLTVGANGTTLVADSAEATGLKWATPAGGGDYVYVGGTTFSASSTVNVNDVFSATYDNYIAYINYTASADSGSTYRLRVSGADNTTSNYNTQNIASYASTVAGSRTANSSSFPLPNPTIDGTAHIINFLNPFATAKTIVFGSHLTFASSSIEAQFSTNAFAATTSFTGFTLFGGTGNITGTVRVYGLANS
jgi:hypothetical protein